MNSLFKSALWAVAILVAVLAARSILGAKDAKWQARVDVEMARAEIALLVGDSLRSEADSLREDVDALVLEAKNRQPVIVRMIETLLAPPLDALPFTAPRDSVIAVQQEQIEDLFFAIDAERKASGLLRAAEEQARMAADSLYAVLDDRPRPLSPLIPSVGIGATAGICTTGQPCVAVGFTLSWEVKLF